MVNYSEEPFLTLKTDGREIASFVSKEEKNIDWTTVRSFGEEWQKFNAFDEEEVKKIGDDYFDLLTEDLTRQINTALDVGCGSGRWARYLSSRVGSIEAIDPSEAVWSASLYLRDKNNVRVSQASVDRIPFPDKSFDLVYSLGVLHHLPDTRSAIEKCYQKVKPGGWILIYLYYALENRSSLYRGLFHVSTFFRRIICTWPGPLKKGVCDLIAATAYLPAALVCRGLYTVPSLRLFADRLPLSYYRKTSFHIMRNDALDRFGTPLEKRFTRGEIINLLTQTGFVNVRFSAKQPYWHVIAQRTS